MKQANSMKKVSVSGWITKNSKEKWKYLANACNETMSSFLDRMIREIVDKPSQATALIVTNEKDSKVKLSVRLSKSSLHYLDELAKRTQESRQKIIAQAIYKFLVEYPSIDKSSRQDLVQSVLELNKIGINLNQVSRILNAKQKQNDSQNIQEQVNTLVKIIPLLSKKIDETSKAVEICLNTFIPDNKLNKFTDSK